MMTETIRFEESRIRRLTTPACMLGESPMWHSVRNRAFWVDILGNAIFEYDLDRGSLTSYRGRGMISLLCQADHVQDVLVVGAQGGVGMYDLNSQALSLVVDLGRDWGDHRCNDGGVDCLGNLWVGSTQMDHAPGGGDLYRVSAGWKAEKKIERVSISNGMCWSPDNRTLYHTDSPTREIRAFKFLAETGEITFDRVAVRVAASMGFPDGIAMDTNGTIWAAIWGSGGVGGYNPMTGALEHWIPLPAPHVSSCAFVGPELDRLLVTTARKELDKTQLARYPESGHTFLIEMDVPGLPTYPCKLPMPGGA